MRNFFALLAVSLAAALVLSCSGNSPDNADGFNSRVPAAAVSSSSSASSVSSSSTSSSSGATAFYDTEYGLLSGTARISALADARGGYVVRNIGNGPANYVTMRGIIGVAGSVPHQLYISYLCKGTKTLFYSINGGRANSVRLTGTGVNSINYIILTNKLEAGSSNTIKFFNNFAPAPDLDCIEIVPL
jgi:hypothetical protein